MADTAPTLEGEEFFDFAAALIASVPVLLLLLWPCFDAITGDARADVEGVAIPLSLSHTDSRAAGFCA
jgi:hypothetical protein